MPPSQPIVLVTCLGLVWAGLGITDWAYRFARFRWHETLVPAWDRGEGGLRDVTVELPLRRGGDLSRLLGPAGDPFAEDRPPGSLHWDARGNLNRPRPEARSPAVVVAGDSFMRYGVSHDHTLAAALEDRLGVPVRNVARAGEGPLASAYRFLRSPDAAPALLVFGFVERQIPDGFRAGPRIGGHALAPAALGAVLPETSVWTWFGRAQWARVGRRLDPSSDAEAIEGRPGFPEGPMLFLAQTVRALEPSVDPRDLDLVARQIARLAEACARRDIRMLVLLIPDKARVYPHQVLAEGAALAPSALDGLEIRLRERKVETMNLLPAFQALAEQGERLYWRDDTHWNDRGIAHAADRIQSLLVSP